MTTSLLRSADSAYPARLSEHPDLDATRAARVPRVRLAEDDDDLRLGLTALLRFDGYDVYAVADGTSLLDKLGSRLLSEGFESILETGSCAKPQEYCVVF